MFDYDAKSLQALITELTRSQLNPEAGVWLDEKLTLLASKNQSVINAAFVMMPRKCGKSIIEISNTQTARINQIKAGFSVEGWSADKLGRLCLLLHLDPTDKEKYFKTIENLFLAAEVSELVALYSSLPVLAWPELWKMRCAEGIRSNIGTVLEAIMYNNPYPERYLGEKAWNQLVLKAFFTEKDINRIAGLDDRANIELAHTLSDYAHERWAANREVNPLLWRLTYKFIDEDILNDLKKIFEEGSLREKQAAALTVFHSGFEPAKELLNEHKDLDSAIKRKELRWDTLSREV